MENKRAPRPFQMWYTVVLLSISHTGWTSFRIPENCNDSNGNVWTLLDVSVKSMVHRFGVIMERITNKWCPNHHALSESQWGKIVSKNSKETLWFRLRLHSHKQCFWVSVCKGHRVKSEDTPILYNHVPTGKARCTTNHCTCNILCGCFLAHKIAQNFARNWGVIPCWFQYWDAVGNTSCVSESTCLPNYTNIARNWTCYPCKDLSTDNHMGPNLIWIVVF